MANIKAFIVWSKGVLGGEISCASVEEFLVRINKPLGSGPWKLTREDIPLLRGMAAKPHEDGENPYADLLASLMSYGEIQVRIELAAVSAAGRLQPYS